MRKRIAALLLAGLLVSAGAAAPEDAPRGYVALTFDDGPSGTTEALSRALKSRGVRATFFVCGCCVQENPDALRQAAADGHEIGLHSYSHSYLHKTPQSDIEDDLRRCAGVVNACCGVTPRLFRPPGGLCSDALTRASDAMGLSVILWSVDPEDWRRQEADNIVRSVLENVRSGDVILMHELHETSAEAALRIVDTLQREGWQFCTVSELAELTGTPLQSGGAYKRFNLPDS